jgi:hypothetical protein
MVRAAVLSLVFVVAAGPSLPVLCKAWCATPAAGSGCHHGHHGATTRAEKNDSCQDQVLVATVYREDTRRRTAADKGTGWAITRSAFLRPYLSELRLPDHPPRERSDPRSILHTPLRI